jgi:hypothetical protein
MCRHHCNEDIGCSLYGINIDHKTSGACYETPEKNLIGKKMEDFSVVSWEKVVESVRRKEASPIFVPTVDNSCLKCYFRGKKQGRGINLDPVRFEEYPRQP